MILFVRMYIWTTGWGGWRAHAMFYRFEFLQTVSQTGMLAKLQSLSINRRLEILKITVPMQSENNQYDNMFITRNICKNVVLKSIIDKMPYISVK